MTSDKNRCHVRGNLRALRGIPKSRARSRAAIAAAMVAGGALPWLAPTPVRATTQFWDVNGSTAGFGGNGTWDLITPNWNDSTGTAAPTTWTDGNDATFSPPSATPFTSTVTVSGSRTVGILTFTATAALQNYTISGGTITLTNTAQGILMATNTSGTNTGEVILSNLVVSGDLLVQRNQSLNGTLLNIGGGGSTGTTVS